ncbi:TPA: hypothetical protein OUD88_002880 [Enterobacter hormaechei]|nr:hypothetical protein [Enterobacter hormaechei]
MIYVPSPYLLKDTLPFKLTTNHLLVFGYLVGKAEKENRLYGEHQGTIEASYTEIMPFVRKSRRFMSDCMDKLEANKMIKRHIITGTVTMYELLPSSNYFDADKIKEEGNVL